MMRKYVFPLSQIYFKKLEENRIAFSPSGYRKQNLTKENGNIPLETRHKGLNMIKKKKKEKRKPLM